MDRTEQVQRLFDLSLDLLVVTRPDLTVVRVNPSWERVLGRLPDELAGTTLTDLIHPDDRERSLAEVSAVRRGHASFGFENRLRHADGTYRWLRWSSVGSASDGLIYAAARDVTERRLALEETQAGVRRLEEAQRVARLGSFEFDLHTDERFYTAEMYHLYGLDPEQDTPLSFDEFLDRVVAADRARVAATIDTAARLGGRHGTDFRLVHDPSCVLHAIIEIERDEDGAPAIARGTVQDVTALREEEAMRRASERRLAEAERLAGIGSFEWRVSDGHVVWSDGMYRLYGVPAGSQPIGGRAFYERMRPAEARAARAAIRRAAETLGGYEIDFHMTDAQGVERAMTARGEAYVVEGELQVRGTVQDVTRLRRIGEQQHEIARLGQMALAGTDLPTLLGDACEAVVRVLEGADASHAIETHANGTYSILGAYGWEQVPSTRPVRASPGSILLHVLAGHPTVVTDWRTEHRFPYPPVLREAGICSSAILPIGGRELPFGALAVHSYRACQFGTDEFPFLGALGTLIATAVERTRADEEIAELAALRGRLVAENLEAEERTRRRISEALHDGALQDLLAARQDLVEAGGRAQDRDDLIGMARAGVERAVQQLREAVSALHPVVLQHGGLAAAIGATAEVPARQGGFRPRITVQDDAAGAHDELVLSVARELLSNVAKHAAARHVEVAVRRAGDTIVVEVIDDGRGVDPADVRAAPRLGHIGLASLTQRVEAVGGTLSIEGEAGRGTVARATLPAG